MTLDRFSPYFENEVIRKRPYLRREWCVGVVEHAVREEPQEKNRVRFYVPIAELGGATASGIHVRGPPYNS